MFSKFDKILVGGYNCLDEKFLLFMVCEMKKINMLALVVLVSVNVFTPISYAGEIPEDEVEFSDIVVENFAEWDESGTLENENLEDENSKSYDLWDSEFLKDGVQSNVDESQVEGRESEQLLGGEEVEAVEKSEIETLVQSESEDTEFTDLSINVDEPEISIKAAAPIIRTITHDAGKWVIKLKIGDTELRIKDKNEGAKKTLLSSEAFQLKQLMDSMCEVQHENFESLAVSAESSTKLVNYDPYSNYVCDEWFAWAATTLVWDVIDSYADAMDYLRDNYNTPTTDAYGNYYRWGNTPWYAKYEELSCQQNTAVLKADDQNSLESCDNLIIADTAEDRWFMNMSDLNNAWWFEWYYDNPCDVSKWEYLPSPDDWWQLVDMWWSIKWKDTSVIKSAGFGIGDVSDFMQDLMIPNAWTIAVGSAGPEKTAKGSLWLEDEWLLYYSSQPDYLWSSKWWNYQQPWWLVLYNDWEYGEGYYWNLEYESANPVRCFVVPEDQRTTVKLVDWKEEKTIIIQKWTAIKGLETPTKNGYTFEWWYTEDDEEWDFDTDVQNDEIALYAKWRVCGEWFAVKNNKCIPDGMNMEWVIEVSYWNDTMYIKDRNVWVNEAVDVEKLGVLYDCLNNTTSSENLLNCVNNGLKTSFEDISDVFDYLEDLGSQLYGNFYFRWNNSWTNYSKLEIGDNWNVDMSELDAKFLEWWKLWNSEGNWWIKWNIQNNPCNGEWEYLPTSEDWEDLITIWMNKNGYGVNGSNPGESLLPWTKSLYTFLQWSEGWSEESFPWGSLNGQMMWKFLQDMLIPYAWGINYDKCPVDSNGWEMAASVADVWWCTDSMQYQDLMGVALWTAQNEDKVWLFWNSIFTNTVTVEDAIVNWLNGNAVPVRCFVNVPQVFVVTLYSDEKIYKEVNVVNWDTLAELPKKSWYTFEWWYTEDNEKWNLDEDTVNWDMTLYAKWTKVENNTSSYSGWWGSSRPTDSDNTNSNGNADKLDTSKDEQWEQWNQNDSSTDSQDKSSTQDKWWKDATKWRGSDASRVVSDETKYDSSYSKELNAAYQFSYRNWITTQPTIKDAKTDGKLTRIQMAKMLSYYAMNVLWQEPDLSRWNVFRDVSRKLDAQYDNAVTLSYQLWIMWINMPNNEFRPFDYVPRSEFVTALSRMIYDDVPDGLNAKFYEPHMAKLYNEWVITNTNPKMLEHRWYVMLMLYRTLTSI